MVRMARRLAGTRAKEVDEALHDEKHRREAAVVGATKPKVVRPKEPETTWFLLKWDLRSSFKTIHEGTREGCLQKFADYRKKNPKDNTMVYLAHGLKVIGY